MHTLVEATANTYHMEILPPEEAIQAEDIAIAERIGLAPDDLAELMVTKVHHLGTVAVLGTDERVPVQRFHCGPEDTIKRGGTKFKAYPTVNRQIEDGIDHGRAMMYKLGAVGETRYSGGKTINNFNPRKHSPEQRIDAMRQVASLVHEAGLADPSIDGTAGDEGTNGDIKYFVEELRARGVAHPEACITGKPDMRPRAAATGRGAAIAQRTHMEFDDETSVRSVVQGAGFAGLYYAAEGFDPLYAKDKERRIATVTLGDLDPKTMRRAALTTDHPEGLPITHKMADALLGKDDRDMKAAGGYKLAALARKIERTTDVEVRIEDKDVLTYDRNLGPDMRLVPAATSNVITEDNIGDIRIKRVDEVGNHVFSHGILPHLRKFGITYTSGEENNAGGTFMSTEENRRDLARIQAIETNTTYDEPTDAEYNRRLHKRMRQNAQRIHRVAEALELDQPQAVRVVALANYALTHGMRIDEKVRQLVAA